MNHNLYLIVFFFQSALAEQMEKAGHIQYLKSQFKTHNVDLPPTWTKQEQCRQCVELSTLMSAVAILVRIRIT